MRSQHGKHIGPIFCKHSQHLNTVSSTRHSFVVVVLVSGVARSYKCYKFYDALVEFSEGCKITTFTIRIGL